MVITLGLMQLGAMVGAPLAGWVFDKWHSYEGAWSALAAFAAAAIFIVASMPAANAAPLAELRAEEHTL